MAADSSFDRHELVSKFRRQINIMWLVILVLLILNFIQFSGKGKVAAILVDGTPVAHVEDKDAAEAVLSSVLDGVKQQKGVSQARFANAVRIAAISKRNVASLDDQAGAAARLSRYTKVLVYAVVAQNNQTGEDLVALPSTDALRELQARVASEAAAKQLPANLQPLVDTTESKQWVDSELAFRTPEEAYAYLSGGKMPAAPVADSPTTPDSGAPAAAPAPKPKATTPATRPSSSSSISTYTVKEGDTAWGICKRLKISLSQLERHNPGLNLDVIRPGDKLKVPGRGN